MAIPAFDRILNILPPHLGVPTQVRDLSPYHCTMQELCDRFATSPERKAILQGFLDFRGELFRSGLSGFQWIDGSFLEDIETQEGRPPRDIDVVTFIGNPPHPKNLRVAINANDPRLLDREYVMEQYLVDHYLVGLGTAPHVLVSTSRYWYGLFSHRRDGQWKGMLQMDLTDSADDAAARMLLGGKP